MPEVATKYRLTAEQFLLMAEKGVFPPDARLELIDGEIVEMSPSGPRHAEATTRLIEAFSSLQRGAILRVQCPGRLSRHGLPQPDFLLARRRPGGYATGHPAPEEILLLVEVADSSLEYDREVKAELYARSGIPEYWIVDLVENRIEVHRRPAGGAWQETFFRGPGESLAAAAFPDHSVNVGDLLP